MFEAEIEGGISIRALSLEDGEALFALIEDNRTYFIDWIPFVSKTHAPSDILPYIQGYIEKEALGDGFLCGIWQADILIGIILVREIDREAKWAEIGYMIDEGHSGRGIITRASKMLITHLFQARGMDKIVICCDAKNEGSVALARKLGFTFEGNMRNHYVVNGKITDMNHWGLLKKEFKEA
ncbi:MAG: GNAT family protein [Spirochaetota bacterium]